MRFEDDEREGQVLPSGANASQALIPSMQGIQPPKPSASGFNPGIWSSIMGSQLADAASTQYALRNPHMQEGNPLLGGGNPAIAYPLKLGIGAAASYGLSKMMPNHPKLAKGLATGLSLGTGLIAGNNLRLAQQR